LFSSVPPTFLSSQIPQQAATRESASDAAPANDELHQADWNSGRINNGLRGNCAACRVMLSEPFIQAYHGAYS